MTQYLVPKKDAAAFFGVSVQALDGWFTRGCPIAEQDSHGRIKAVDLSAMARWRVEKAEGNLDADRARLARAQAERTELELAELRGLVVRTDEVAAAWTNEIARARTRLLAMPNKLGPLCRSVPTDAAAAGLIEAEVLQALEELSKDGVPERARRRREAGAARVAAAAETDGVRVGGSTPAPVVGKRGRAGPMAH